MSNNKKLDSRKRRSRRTRAKIREYAETRLCVHRTLYHIYAQVISPCGAKVLATASTLEKDMKAKIKNGGNIEAAKLVGELLAKRAQEAGVKRVSFDRSGYKFHGRIKALAEAAREGGMEF